MLAVSQSVAGTTIGVQFQGRDGSGDVACPMGNCPAVPALFSVDVAGVVPQANWNPVDDHYGFLPTVEKGTTIELQDSDGFSTTVTLTFDCNDSWFNDVTPTNILSANARLMNGIIKSSAGGGVPGLFTFNGVPEGQYDLYVYTDMNGNGTQAAISDGDLLTTYYVTLQHRFFDTNTFIQGINTNPTGPGLTNVCNYVKLSNLGTYGRGQIGAQAKWLATNDGVGISGLQLVNTGPPLANTNGVSIFKQPNSRRVLVGETNVTVSVYQATKGPVFSWQWYKSGTLISGATSATYLLPTIAPTDDGAFFYAVVSNNVNTAQSANAVLTVRQPLTVSGVQTKLWFTTTAAIAATLRTNIEAGSFDAITPDISLFLYAFQTPDNQGDNYGERVSALFTPKVSGNYVFFISADDDSDLFLSTDATPANKRPIAQEVNWAGDREWVANSGGTGNRAVTQKRSDQWSPDTNTPPPNANGITLAAGTDYYIEAVHHEGGGGDHLEATFKLVGELDPQNGDPSRLQALDGAYIVVTNQPQDATGLQSRTATFKIGATSGYIADASGLSPAIGYHWQTAPSGSSTFTNILGANGTTFITPLLALADNGRKYRAAVLAGDATTNSAAATLTVTPDTTPPRPVEVTGVSRDGKTVTLVFDELMAKAATETASGYVFNPGPGNITATTASLDAGLTTVTITTGAAALTPGVTNVLALSAATDLAGNLVAPNTTISFTFQPVTYAADILFDQPLGFYRFEEPAGTAVATNSGSTGGDGAYYTGNEPAGMPGVGGTPSSASGDPGPRPPLFAGFDANNHAATFDGTNRWVDTKNQFLQHRAAFTLEYWISPTNRVADPTTFGGARAGRIGIVGQNDAIEYGFIDANTIQIWTPNGGSLNTAYTNADNEWHHVATIASGTSLKTYYDGALVGTTAGVTNDYGNSVFNVHIGGAGVFDADGNWFTGYIDEVAIFDKAIPAARVAEHYKAGKFGGVVTVSGAVTPSISNVRLGISKSGNNLSISWTPSGGTLQATPALLNVGTLWTNVGTANPATISIGPGSSFYRVSQ